MKHVIIGNGPAGVVAAEALRRADASADIVMNGDEREPPYSRMAIPYLLFGNIEEKGTWLSKTDGHFASLGIREVLGRAKSGDIAARVVHTENGTALPCGKLLICTGSHLLRLSVPGIDSPNVHSWWTLDDARHIAAKAQKGARVRQIDARFIDCVILEALASRRVKLDIVDMGDRMVPCMMTTKAGSMIARWVEQKSLNVHTNARVTSIQQEGGALVATLGDGKEVTADLIIGAAGFKPNIAFLERSGIACSTGILMDARCETNVPGVFAAGDVAEAVDFSTGERLVNSIQPNALDQGRVVAVNMAGRNTRSQGTMAINLLDTLGLISASFGQWWGDGGDAVEMIDEKRFRYIRLQFKEDVFVGATSIGLTDYVGVPRDLIQTRTPLGTWKERLMHDPLCVMEAYLSSAQAQSAAPLAGVAH